MCAALGQNFYLTHRNIDGVRSRLAFVERRCVGLVLLLLLIISVVFHLGLLHSSLEAFGHGSISFTPQAETPNPAGNPSSFAGGVPGLSALNNVWYRDHLFYAFTQEPIMFPFPDQLSQHNVEFVISPYSMLTTPSGAENARYLRGSTVFLNDGGVWGEWSYLSHFYHFGAEVMMGALAVFSSIGHAQDKLVDRIIIPWETEWRDVTGVNEFMVQAGFEEVIEQDAWTSMTNLSGPADNQGWLFFPQIVFIDRKASHVHNLLAQRWNKMALPALVQPHRPTFFEPFRRAVSAQASARPTSRLRKGHVVKREPHIIYVDRQSTSRRLADSSHTALLEVLGELSEGAAALTSHVTWETKPIHEQIALASEADILIGVHGMGMTHALWMPQGGVLLELLPTNCFILDCPLMTMALGHQYIGTWNDTTYPVENWAGHIGELNSNRLHDGTEITLDKAFIRSVLNDAVRAMRASPVW